MDEAALLSLLEDLASGLGIEVRQESMDSEAGFSSGGLCRIRGKSVIIVNQKAALQDKIKILARALNRMDLGQVYMKPALREFLEKMEHLMLLKEKGLFFFLFRIFPISEIHSSIKVQIFG